MTTEIKSENIRKKVTSPVRQEKLKEGQKILEKMENLSPLEQLYRLFVDRTTPESGFSIRELALLFFPKHSRIDPQTGNPTPTLKGIDLVYALLNVFRKSVYNKSMLLFTSANPVKTEGNVEISESVVYKKTTIRSFEDTRKKINKIIAGLAESIENALEIFAQTPEEIARRDEEFLKALQQTSKRSRHRRSTSDYNGDEDLYK